MNYSKTVFMVSLIRDKQVTNPRNLLSDGRTSVYPVDYRHNQKTLQIIRRKTKIVTKHSNNLYFRCATVASVLSQDLAIFCDFKPREGQSTGYFL